MVAFWSRIKKPSIRAAKINPALSLADMRALLPLAAAGVQTLRDGERNGPLSDSKSGLVVFVDHAIAVFAPRRAPKVAQLLTSGVAAHCESDAGRVKTFRQKNDRFGLGQVAFLAIGSVFGAAKGEQRR